MQKGTIHGHRMQHPFNVLKTTNVWCICVAIIRLTINWQFWIGLNSPSGAALISCQWYCIYVKTKRPMQVCMCTCMCALVRLYAYVCAVINMRPCSERLLNTYTETHTHRLMLAIDSAIWAISPQSHKWRCIVERLKHFILFRFILCKSIMISTWNFLDGKEIEKNSCFSCWRKFFFATC